MAPCVINGVTVFEGTIFMLPPVTNPNLGWFNCYILAIELVVISVSQGFSPPFNFSIIKVPA